MDLQPTLTVKGRGAAGNPANRFYPIHYVPEGDLPDEDRASPKTRLFVDHSRSIVTTNDSPDVGIEYSINPYRGCEHGCIYCFARPTHEYYGLSAGLDFETQIMVKLDAPRLLRQQLLDQKWKPVPISVSGVTDCYQPIERKLRLTRQCLEVMAEFRQPLAIITKNRLVTRDKDVLATLAAHQAAQVYLSITTLDDELAGLMEPRATRPAGRLAAIRELTEAGVPAGVMIAPVIPGLTDHEMPNILAVAREAGAIGAGYVPLRLPFAVKDLFVRWLEAHFPARKDKILGRIRSIRGGKLNDSNFGTRMRGEGVWPEVFEQQFHIHEKRLGYPADIPELNTSAFRRPGDQQGLLFE
jgi:DNA repair photolyase